MNSYWGEGGFFRIVRGVNNLGIESDCHYVVPEITEEDLVWSEKKMYGGSIYGIVPFAGVAEFNDTSNATLSNTTLTSHELPEKKSSDDITAPLDSTMLLANTPSSSPDTDKTLGFAIAGCAGVVVGVLIATKKHGNNQYQLIH